MACKSIFLSALVMTGMALCAEEPQQAGVKAAPKASSKLEELRWGVQAGVAFPTTDTFKYFSDKGTGFALGAQATWDWKPDWRWRARIDYTAFPKATVNSLALHAVREDDTITGISGGVDLLWFTSGKSEGFYLTGGLALANWKQETSTTGSTTSTNLGIAAGLGWQFNRTFGLEARTFWSRWDTNIVPTTTHNAGMVRLEGSVRF